MAMVGDGWPTRRSRLGRASDKSRHLPRTTTKDTSWAVRFSRAVGWSEVPTPWSRLTMPRARARIAWPFFRSPIRRV